MQQFIKKIVRVSLKRQRSTVFYIKRTWQRWRQYIHQNWITILTSSLSIALCLLTSYLFLSPLPEFTIPDFNDELSSTVSESRARTLPLLNTYLQPLKMRNLFKPSIPIPIQKKIGKTTAQQLAERLQFLGTTGEERNLSALVFIPQRGPALFKENDMVAEFILKEINKEYLVLELENEQIILKR